MDTKNCVQSDSVSGQTTRCYESALSELAMTRLSLIFNDSTTSQLKHFIAAALELHDAHNTDTTFDRPIDILLWLRRRLNQEANNPEQNELYRAQCLREVSRVEREIDATCVALSQRGLTVLK
ncbi:MAG: hypothetical protein OIF57_02985 [Marinobacterium sp.]|nr:hypothetical protein [Marinobacterium sp.]